MSQTLLVSSWGEAVYRRPRSNGQAKKLRLIEWHGDQIPEIFDVERISQI